MFVVNDINPPVTRGQKGNPAFSVRKNESVIVGNVAIIYSNVKG